MKSYSIILLALLVFLPLLLLAWGGVQLAAFEQEKVQANIREILTNQLAQIDRSIQNQFDQLAEEMRELTSLDVYQFGELRDIAREDPRMTQLFVIDPNDFLIYPNPNGALTATERNFLMKAADLINDRELQLSDPQKANEGIIKPKTASQKQSPISGSWHVWYWGSGMHLIYWQRRPDGHIVGVALERARWVADVIIQLPDTPVSVESETASASRTQIVESGSNVIYKWGAYNPPANESFAAEYRLAAPLTAWQLQAFVPIEVLSAGQSGTQNLIAGLIISGLALMALAIAIGRQYGRDMREATRRVSFVNQVSHELRTPLTNIRMYAELLSQDLESFDVEEKPQRRLQVILNECQRLSRLIGNVLTFARQERKTLQVCSKSVVVDDIIQQVVDSFRPSLEQKQFEVKLDLNARETVEVDPDMLEQILVNLISNVEKYAASGKWMKITSQLNNSLVSISVLDRGPGIDAEQRGQVFKPFGRASDNLSQSAGTGIGLSIVQHLARLHGGDANIVASGEGSQFRVTLQNLGGSGNENSDR